MSMGSVVSECLGSVVSDQINGYFRIFSGLGFGRGKAGQGAGAFWPGGVLDLRGV